MASLPEDLESLLVGQPPVDWPGAVGQAVRARGQRRNVLLGVAALLVVAVIGGGVALAVSGDDPAPRQQATDELSPTTSTTPSPTASASRQPLPEIVAEAQSLTPDSDCETTAPPVGTLPSVAPGAAGEDNVVTVGVKVNCTTIAVGQTLFVRATSTATQSRATEFSSSFTPGGVATRQDNSTCGPVPVAGAKAGTATTVLSGSFMKVGTQRLTVQATTPDPCIAAPGGAAVTFDITVVATPTPTPTTTPSATPTPSATATASATPSVTVTPSVTPSTSATPGTSATPSTTAGPTPTVSIATVNGPQTVSRTAGSVTYSVQLSSNVGEPRLTAAADGAPAVPSCTPGEAFRSGTFNGTRNLTVQLPSTPGTYTVSILAYAQPGCQADGQRASTRATRTVTVL